MVVADWLAACLKLALFLYVNKRSRLLLYDLAVNWRRCHLILQSGPRFLSNPLWLATANPASVHSLPQIKYLSGRITCAQEREKVSIYLDTGHRQLR